ncbi:heme ABC transporter ATP-binding protein [Kocuria massiliensis]|uniref:heme ABC transporter ATP-binding protein n=1 Tax=Kocuria massiliensis TaxID=1926282 RepID=UPI0022B9B840|nr:heme ABC transporter ATP-binding protein [Kocuria massiliensis]
MELVKIEHVTHDVGDRRILHDVSLRVESGELVVMIGPNGAGKSTVLSVMAGDLRPSRGSVTFDGSAVGRWSVPDLARRRSVLLQKSSVSFPYAVREVVEMGRTPWRGRPESSEDEASVLDAMNVTDVARLAARDITTLSGGEAARAHLARVVAQRAPLMMLDEPTAALDILHQEHVMRTCRRLTEAGAGIVVVLHDLDLAAAYADRILLFSEGRLTADGPPEEVMVPDRLSEVYGWPIDVIRHPGTGRLVVLPVREAEAARGVNVTNDSFDDRGGLSWTS